MAHSLEDIRKLRNGRGTSVASSSDSKKGHSVDEIRRLGGRTVYKDTPSVQGTKVSTPTATNNVTTPSKTNRMDTLEGRYGVVTGNATNDSLNAMLRDFRNIQSALATPKNLPEFKSDSELKDYYESLPDYNMFERIADEEKREKYNEKQALSSKYDEIKKANDLATLKAYGVTDDDLLKAQAYLQGATGGVFNKKYMNERTSKEEMQQIYDKFDRVREETGINPYELQFDYQTQIDEELANEHPISSTINTYIANPVESTLNTGKKVANYVTGKPLENDYSYTNNIRNTVSENIDSEVGRFAYGTVNSIADMAVAAGLSQLTGTRYLGAGLQGFEKADAVMNESINRGLNPTQIMLEGIASGVTTAATESIPMGQWEQIAKKKLVGLGKEAIKKNIVKKLLAGMASEGLQEMSEDVADLLVDNLIAGDKSEIETNVRTIMANNPNMTREEAEALAWKDWCVQVVLDGLGGAISGGVMSGLSIGVGLANPYATGYINRESLSEQIRKMDPESEVYKSYWELAKEKGTDLKDASDDEVSELFQKAYAEASKADRTAYEEVIANKLREANYTDSEIKETLEALTAENPTRRQKFLVNNELVSDAVKEADEKEGLKMIKKVAEKVSAIDQTIKTAKEVKEETRIKEAESKINTSTESSVNGEKVDVYGMDVKGGVYVVNTSKGSFPVEDVKIASDIKDAVSYSVNITDNNMKEAFVSNYQGQDIEAYEAYAYRAFMAGKRFNQALVDEATIDFLGAKAVHDFADAGRLSVRKETKDSEERAIKAASEAKGKFKQGTFTNNVDYTKLDSTRKKLFNFLKGLSNIGGLHVNVIYDENTVSNGSFDYDAQGGVITVNLAARLSDASSKELATYVIPTLSHELTHYLQANAETAYNALEKAVLKSLRAQNIDIDAEVNRKINSYKEATKGKVILTPSEALDEIVAQACEGMMSSEETMEKTLSFMNVREVKTFKKALEKFFNAVKSFVKSLSGSDAQMNRYALAVSNNIDEIQDAWAKAFAVALERQQILNGESSTDVGVQIDSDTDTAAFSIRTTLLETYQDLKFKNYDQAVEYTAISIANQLTDTDIDIKPNNYKKAIEYMEKNADYKEMYEKALKWVKSEDSIAAFIAKEGNKEFLDYVPDERYEAIKKNSDYSQGTFDLSNLCRKRELFTLIFDNLQLANPDILFTAEDIALIRDVMVKSHEEVACALCYVEDRRQLMGEIAETFINMYKDALKTKDKVIIKTTSEGERKPLTVTEDQAEKHGYEYKSTYKATDSYIPTQADLITYKGFKNLTENHPTIAHAFENYNNSRGMQAGRLVEGHAEYKREVLKYTKSQVEAKNKKGGLRIFSFSDLEGIHVIDLMQLLIDASSKGLYAQAYTKVPAFARIVKDTGVKLNRSLIPANKDSQNAYAFINGKWTNVVGKLKEDGIATVNGKEYLAVDTVEGIDVTSKDFINDPSNPNIGNIIIGISDKQIELALSDPNVDYVIPFHTGQSDKILHMKGIDVWKNYKDFQEDKGSGKKINIYTDVIEKYNVTNQKEFVDSFKKECAKRKLTPRFDAFKGNDGYYKLLLDYKLFDKEGNILPQGKITPSFDEETLKYIKSFLLADKKRSQNLKMSDDTMDAIYKAFDEKGKHINPISDKKFSLRESDMVDSDGNKLTQNQAEYYKESMARDDEGHLLVLYHGTSQAGFNVFKPGRYGIMMTTSMKDALSYGGADTLYNPNEEMIDLKVKSGNFMIGKHLRFDTEEERAEFLKNNPDAESYMTQREIYERENEIEDNFEDKGYDKAIEDLRKKEEISKTIRKEYAKYQYPRSKVITLQEMIDNADLYTVYDFKKALEQMDSEAAFDDEYEYDSDSDFKEALLESLEYMKEEYPDESDFANIWVRVRIPADEEAISPNVNRVYNRAYKLYANARHPYIVDMHGGHSEGNDRYYNALINYMESDEYDSIIIKNMRVGRYQELGTVVAVKSSEQVNLTSNQNPTDNPDIRYSIREDSEGNTLSEEQAKYFKDSKIVDENGNLKVVYHGTDANFFEFKTDDFGGKNGRAEGYGIYFTSDKEITEKYGNRQLKGYLNITKPAYSNKKTISSTQLAKFIKDLCEYQADQMVSDGEYDNKSDAIKDTWISNYEYTYDKPMDTVYRLVANNILKTNSNDMNIIQEVMFGYGIYSYKQANEFYARLKKSLGFDGFVTYWTWSDGQGESEIDVAFDSNQFKLADNLNPTNKPDIRFSLRMSEDLSDEERYNILKDRSLSLSAKVNESKLKNKSEYNRLISKRLTVSEKKKIITTLAKEFNVIADYSNKDVNLEFTFSGNNLAESLSKQKAPYSDYAKLLTCFSDVIDNAIGIEVHRRENYKKGDPTLKRVYVLTSAFTDDNYIYPVKLEIKEFKDKKNTLYVVASFDRIKKDGFIAVRDGKTVAQIAPPSDISLSWFFNNINDSDNSLLKYVPKQFFENNKNSIRESNPDLVTDKEKEKIKALKNDVALLKEYLKLDSEVTNGQVWNPKDVDLIAANIIEKTDTKLSRKDLRQELSDLYNYIAKYVSRSEAEPKTSDDYERVMDRCYQVASRIYELSSKKVKVDANVDPEAKQTIAELKEREVIQNMAVDLYNYYWRLKRLRTTADKLTEEKEKAIKKLDAEHKKNIASIVEGQKLADTIYYKDIINKLKNKAEKEKTEIKEQNKAKAAEQKADAERSAEIQKITDKAITLSKWVLQNSKNHPVPDPLRTPLLKLLGAIDPSSKQLLGLTDNKKNPEKNFTPTKKDESMSLILQQVANALKNIDQEIEKTDSESGDVESGLGFIDIPPYMVDKLTDVATNMHRIEDKYDVLGNKVLQMMDLEDLKELRQDMSVIQNAIATVNSAISQGNKIRINYVAQMIIQYLKDLGQTKRDSMNQYLAKGIDFLTLDNTTPYYFFKHLGEGGETVFKFFADGMDKMTQRVKTISDFTDNLYTEKEQKEWRNNIREFEIVQKLTDTERANGLKEKKVKIKLTDAQIMSLYCLSKREQNGRKVALEHILRDGIAIGKIDQKKKVGRQDTVTITESQLNDIISIVENDERMKAVADGLQKFMSTVCSDWGNEVTMARWMIRQFTEDHYFPVNVNKETTKSDNIDRNGSLFALLNMDFTKPLQDKVRNEIMVYDIFDVFTKHTSDMARYSSLGLPILDAMKVWNYSEAEEKKADDEKKKKNEAAEQGKTYYSQRQVDSVKKSIAKAFGESNGNKYISNLIKNLNGQAEKGIYDNIGMGMMKRYKASKIAASTMTALVQPLSYIRAGYVMKPKYLAQAFTKLPQVDKCFTNVPVAEWKRMSLGVDTNIGRGLDRIINHQTTFGDKIVDKSLWLAEKMDELTWGYIYNAVEAEIKDTRKDLKPGTDEFDKAVADRCREVFYSTQIFDSTLTRSAFMRDKGYHAIMLSAFMSEPTLSYNMLLDSVVQFNQDKKKNGFGHAFKTKGKVIASAISVYLLSSVVESVIRELYTRFRDYEEDDEEFFEDFWKDAFKRVADELNLLNKLPYTKQIMDGIEAWNKAYSNNNKMDEAFIQDIGKSYKAISKAIDNEEISYNTVYTVLNALSDVTGLPFSNALREVKSVWNNTIGRATGKYIEK